MRKNRKAVVRKPEILENYYQTLIEEGLEGASIAKIAQRMAVNPSLIIHYFKTKENMTVELVDLLIEKYEAPQFLDFSQAADPKQRFQLLMDTIFSLDWSRTVDAGVHFGFYYLSFRKPEIRQRFQKMFERFRDYLAGELKIYQQAGVIPQQDVHRAADMVVTLMEGLEFHAHFLSADRPFDEFARASRQAAVQLLMHPAQRSEEPLQTAPPDNPPGRRGGGGADANGGDRE
jgi:AcrR family transcriptional regulator